MSNQYTYKGYASIETTVKTHSKTASRIYLPESWSNKKVAVILLEK